MVVHVRLGDRAMWRQARARAAEEGVAVGVVVEAALRAYLGLPAYTAGEAVGGGEVGPRRSGVGVQTRAGVMRR